ncbi:hypothetical protein Y032_0003g1381 [Ancylostoma ceylanicum]|uniref:Uncharacterized protein n=1 Tax=Ancylostoma ceylanicum TaxID=53326 RepID=A0A016VXP9_9BILA|nr:hypothetical protein Y032_0003g1381 [Ancylostoma ceylanicum]
MWVMVKNTVRIIDSSMIECHHASRDDPAFMAPPTPGCKYGRGHRGSSHSPLEAHKEHSLIPSLSAIKN